MNRATHYSLSPLAAALMATLGGGTTTAAAGGYGAYVGSRSRPASAPLVSGPLTTDRLSIPPRDQSVYSGGRVHHDRLPAETEQALRRAWLDVRHRLMEWAGSERFNELTLVVFGPGHAEQAHRLRSRFLAGDWRDLPALTMRPAAALAPAAGVYVKDTDTVVLAREFIESAGARQLSAVWLEEIGHALDHRFNTTDRPGDEGAIFARLLQGRSLPPFELAILQGEDDHADIVIDGRRRQVEMATFTVTSSSDSGAGSLREAIASANADSAEDTIDFSGVALVNITSELVVTSPIVFDGDTDANSATRDVTVDATGNSRVLRFTTGSTGSSIDNLVITGGNLAGDGGGISNSSAAAGSADDVHGAGIVNEGVLTITNSDITGNSAGAGGAGGVSSGGAGGFGGYTGSIGGDGQPGGYGNGGEAGSVNYGGDGGDNGGSRVAQGGIGGSLNSGGGSGGSGSAGSGGGGGTAGTAGGGGGGGGADYTGDQDGGHGGSASGGIYNSGTLTIIDAAVAGNLGAGGGGGGSADINSGSAYGGDGGNGVGGIYNAVGGNLTISQSTIDNLSGNVGAGGTAGTGITANGGNGTSENDIFGVYTVSGTEQTFVVDNAGDTVDGDYSAGNQTLREALNQVSSNDTITFDNALSGQTIKLTNGTTLTIPSGLVVIIDGDLDDDGTPDITVSGDANDNSTTDSGDVVVFTIEDGANAEFDGLTITNGFADGAAGANGANEAPSAQGNAGNNAADGDPGQSAGGGIDNAGTLTLSNSEISASVAYGGNGGIGGAGGNAGDGTAGGGIGYSGGVGGAAGAAGHAAGGILNRATGILSLSDVTFSGNDVTAGNGGTGGAGGNGGDGTTDGSTNSGSGGGGGGGGAGGAGGSAASGVLNLGTLSGDATDGGGNTSSAGTGGTGGSGGSGGAGGSTAGTGTGAAGGFPGAGGGPETSGAMGDPGTDGDGGTTGGDGGDGGVFDRDDTTISDPGAGGSSGQRNEAGGVAAGGGGAGGGAGGINGETGVILNAEDGSGSVSNGAPSVALANAVSGISEDADTTARTKVADIVVTDDIFGDNELSLSGADVPLFEIDGSELFLKAGVTLDASSNPSLDVTVEVDDVSVGATPDDTADLTIAVTASGSGGLGDNGGDGGSGAVGVPFLVALITALLGWRRRSRSNVERYRS